MCRLQHHVPLDPDLAATRRLQLLITSSEHLGHFHINTPGLFPSATSDVVTALLTSSSFPDLPHWVKDAPEYRGGRFPKGMRGGIHGT